MRIELVPSTRPGSTDLSAGRSRAYGRIAPQLSLPQPSTAPGCMCLLAAEYLLPKETALRFQLHVSVPRQRHLDNSSARGPFVSFDTTAAYGVWSTFALFQIR
eukprot:4265371-Pleurochrysis_carterae.AAC.2